MSPRGEFRGEGPGNLADVDARLTALLGQGVNNFPEALLGREESDRVHSPFTGFAA